MSSGYGSQGGGFGGGGTRILIGPQRTPVVVRKLIVGLLVVFFAQVLLELLRPVGQLLSSIGVNGITELGALSGVGFFERKWLWQPVTAMVLHDYSALGHLFGNLFFLWMFGSPVADEIGSRRFLRLFFLAGIGAGLIKLCFIGVFYALGWDWSLVGWEVQSIGASGAVFGVVAWYCYRWPDRPISLLFIPVTFTGRQAVPLWFLMEFGMSGGGVDHFVHVAGALIGFLELLRWRRGRRGGAPGGSRGRKVPLSVIRDDGPVYH